MLTKVETDVKPKDDFMHKSQGMKAKLMKNDQKIQTMCNKDQNNQDERNMTEFSHACNAKP